MVEGPFQAPSTRVYEKSASISKTYFYNYLAPFLEHRPIKQWLIHEDFVTEEP